MKFSVIIPLYNKAPYVRKALESVFAQTYTDYELIVVDDGSTDESARIAESILHEAIRLQGYKATRPENGEADIFLPPSLIAQSPNRLLKQTNAGVSAARNNGVAASHGDYVAFLDADDWWAPTYLERMAQLINDYPDAGLYACNYVYYKPGKTHVALNIPTGYINYPKAYYESNAMPVWTGAAMIPRKVFDEMGGFPQGIKLGEDFLLWSKIALQYPVAFLNEPLAWYNNDVPATLRATRNLHAPEHHMLFRLDEVMGYRLEVKGNEEVKGYRLEVKGSENGEADTCASRLSPLASNLTSDSVPASHLSPLNSKLTSDSAPTSRLLPLASRQEDWHNLLDRLRVTGLMEYWLDKRYHDLAAEELKKVDWSKQPPSAIRMYKTPILLLKAKRTYMTLGSYVKQKLIKLRIK